MEVNSVWKENSMAGSCSVKIKYKTLQNVCWLAGCQQKATEAKNKMEYSVHS